MKWFPDKRGLATGMALASFGGGAILAAPMNKYFMEQFFVAPDYLGSSSDVSIVTEGGKRFVEIITGAFAIVIHDRREQILLLFRDNFGQKNIYFTDQNDCFHVSSSIKGIFENSSVPKEMNIERVIDFIAHTHSPSSETFFKKIYIIWGLQKHLNYVNQISK